jgi:Mg2+-importing ATPase
VEIEGQLNTFLMLCLRQDAFIATIMKQLKKKRPLNPFQKGTRNVSYMMLGFMGVMVPIVSAV